MIGTKLIELARDERVVAVVPEHCSGPSWVNSVAWVYIEDSNGSLRMDSIQWDEMPQALATLFHSGQALCSALRLCVPTKRADE